VVLEDIGGVTDSIRCFGDDGRLVERVSISGDSNSGHSNFGHSNFGHSNYDEFVGISNSNREDWWLQ